MLARDLPQVADDLVARRADPRPVATLRKRVGVEVARYVTGRAGVVVVVPCPAEFWSAVVDGDVMLAQGDRGGDATETRTDDRDPHRPDIRTRFRCVSLYARTHGLPPG